MEFSCGQGDTNLPGEFWERLFLLPLSSSFSLCLSVSLSVTLSLSLSLSLSHFPACLLLPAFGLEIERMRCLEPLL